MTAEELEQILVNKPDKISSVYYFAAQRVFDVLLSEGGGADDVPRGEYFPVFHAVEDIVDRGDGVLYPTIFGWRFHNKVGGEW